MKPRLIALVGFIVVLVGFIAGLYLQLIAMLLASAICAAMATGFLFQGHKTRGFWISMGRPNAPENGAQVEIKPLRIEGREFLPAMLPRRLEFALACHNLHMLAAIGLVAFGTVAASLVAPSSPFHPLPPESEAYIVWYVLCYVLGILSIPVLAWLSECALIRRPAVTLAFVHRQSRGRWGTVWVRYHFVDGHGGYHGGSVVNFGGPKEDNLKVVLCDPGNPEKNRISCGFLFHRLSWARSASN